MTTSIWRPSKLIPAFIFLLFILVPVWGHFTDHNFYVAFAARIVIYALAVVALNLALGLGGLVSLGHALFMGLGAYSVALPAYYGIDNGWIHLALCLASCCVVGILTGAISLRTSGIGFIMITLAFAQMGFFLFVSLKQFGGDDGTSISNTSQFFGWDLSNIYTVYIVSLVLLILSTWWTARLRVAPFGMVLRASRQNARRVNAVGFPAQRYLLVAYVISAMLCGVAGMLMANLNAFASPSMLSWVISGDLVVMLVLGGIGTVFGPMLGALAFLGLEEILKMFTDHWMAVFGLVVVLIGLVGKAGIVGLLQSLERRGAAEPAAAAPTPETGAQK